MVIKTFESFLITYLCKLVKKNEVNVFPQKKKKQQPQNRDIYLT